MEKKSKRWQGSLKQAITASTVGNILEWYDFALYGYVAPYIGPLFSPSHDPVASTIAAFAVFAIGYLARPIGAVVLGWTGDRFGRKTMLVISITILGFSSCAIGIMPTYQSIGNFAPVLLVLMRLAQGFSVDIVGIHLWNVGTEPDKINEAACHSGHLLWIRQNS
jgi:MHS family proline/betaine transporter-like MFS transporter